MSATGYVQVHAFTSNAQIPLRNVSIAMTDPSGDMIAMRLTNSSGMLDNPIPITVPDLSASQSPDTQIIPFSTINVIAYIEDYESIVVSDLQVFADTVTDQNLEMIPLSEFPDSYNLTEFFDTPPQDL